MRGTELVRQIEVGILKAIQTVQVIGFHCFQIVVSSTICLLEDMRMIPWQYFTWFPHHIQWLVSREVTILSNITIQCNITKHVKNQLL